jgi:hypothetical protein
VRSTDHEAPHYEVFSTPLLPRPSYTLIFSSTPDSQTPSAYVPPSMSETKFHTHTKRQEELQFCISKSLDFWIAAKVTQVCKFSLGHS